MDCGGGGSNRASEPSIQVVQRLDNAWAKRKKLLSVRPSIMNFFTSCISNRLHMEF